LVNFIKAVFNLV